MADDPQGTDTRFTGQFSPVKRSEENSPSGQIEFSFKVQEMSWGLVVHGKWVSYLAPEERWIYIGLVEEHMLYFGKYAIQKRPEVLGQNSLISLRQGST